MRDDDTHDEIDDTVIRPRHRTASADDPVNDDAVSDDLLGDTVIRPRLDRAADPLGDTVIRPRPVGPADDDTVLRGALAGPEPTTDDTVRGAPPRPPLGAAPLAGPAPRLPAEPRTARVPSVRIGDHVVRLDRPVIVGRRPTLPRVVRGPEPRLVTVRSASGQVSSSHVLVQASGEAAVVEDLRSTNGTVVRPVAGAPFRMPAGGTAVVLTGTVVEIGDGNTVEILSPHLRAAPGDPVPAPPDWP
ncbi:hypothetical protein GCM10009769_01920 [Curtobacterium luteum]|uniref:FHA domain-containing protein n=1 Tax=Curtobacterium luteum TaxID=33881 RepID=A0A8H9G6Y0_9MICO|nr:FHA domain-containing protein [Curtobacterium luteum]GGK87469.1 hypothetical protein GCM10009769_01920 [Curtobacterium luteum]